MRKKTTAATTSTTRPSVPASQQHQYVAVAKALTFRADLTAETAVHNLLSHARDVGRIKVWKIPADVPGILHDDGTFQPDRGESVAVRTPKLPNLLQRHLVANIRRPPRTLPAGTEFLYLAVSRGLAHFCSDTPEMAMQRFSDFTRDAEKIVLWRIPCEVPCAVLLDGKLVPNMGEAKIVPLPKPEKVVKRVSAKKKPPAARVR